MIVFLNSTRIGVAAVGEYNPETKELLVLAGSVLSSDVSKSPTFRGAKSIVKQREGIIENNLLLRDVSFTSPSTAANFVTGRSANGLIAWKDSQNRTLKELFSSKEVGI